MSRPPEQSPVSLWFDELPGGVAPRPALDDDGEVDVAIAGAGFSGLWTAYYLARLRPSLRIAIVEAEVAGWGASGRNGGWCTSDVAGIGGLLAAPETRAGAVGLQRAMFETVDEVGRVCAAESIDCGYHKGGALHVARSPLQQGWLRQLTEKMEGWGFGPDDQRWIEASACDERVRMTGALGGHYTPHCAVLDPARLARALADRVERLGVRIYERSRVTAIEPRRLVTERATLRADFAVRATEAYTAELRGRGRELMPLQTWMIATEPLPAGVWDEIGLADRDALGDARTTVTYAQRTADDRIALGGHGGYRFGSRIPRRFDPADPRFAALREVLVEWFPMLSDVRITHRWGGSFGAPRNWSPRVGVDRERGLGWLGGYVGQGVAASNLAGRTLADLIAGERTERTALCWVRPPARRWEPEPLRAAAAFAAVHLAQAVDRSESRPGPAAALLRRAFAKLTGL